MRTSIGILGGTFDPVHIGHLILAQDALERLELSQVLFVPSAIPPHKDAARLAPALHRMSMLEMAIEGDLRFAASDTELRRDGVSFSIDTVREVRAQYPEADVYFLVGTDALPELHQWRDVSRLLDLCRLTPFRRPGAAGAVDPGRIRLDPPWPKRLASSVIEGHQVDVSSTDIRRRVAEGLSIRYLVPASVEMYIQEHCLYRR